MRQNEAITLENYAGDSVGSLFEGRYHLKELLGSGGFATVYKAWQTDLGREVAVKIYHSFVADDDNFVQRFMREAQALNKIHHENVVSIYHIGSSKNGAPYMVMELLGSDNLRRLMNESKPPTLLSLRIMRDAANALDFVHQNGIVHRDLKPDNIVFVSKPEPYTVKIIDFGLARDSRTENQKLTQTGELLGTPHYMSPEQCAGLKVDAASDIYSLALVLYESLSGMRPYEADSAMGILYKQLNDPLPMLSQDDVDGSFDKINRILRKATEKDPTQRYKNMAEFASDIQRAIDELEADTRDVSDLRRIYFDVKKFSTALAVLLLLAIAAFYFSQTKKSMTPQFDKKEAKVTAYEKKLEQAMAGPSIRSKMVKMAYFFEKTVSEQDLAERASYRKVLLTNLDRLLDEAKTSKTDKWIFLCIRMKARLMSYKHDYLEAIKLTNEALRYCHKPDGSLYFDAADCYLQLAEIQVLVSLDENKIRENALKCIQICKEKGDETFDLPEEERRYLTRPAFIMRCLALLAQSYMRTGEIEKAIQASKQVFESMNFIRGARFFPFNYCEALFLAGKQKEALQAASKILYNLRNRKTSLTEREDFETFLLLGDWYMRHEFFDESKSTYKAAIEYADECNANLLHGANAMHWKKETAKLRSYLADPMAHYMQLCSEHAVDSSIRFLNWGAAVEELGESIKRDSRPSIYYKYAFVYRYLALLHTKGLEAALSSLAEVKKFDDGKEFPDLLIQYFLGDIDEKKLLAGTPLAEQNHAHFFIAEKRLAMNDKEFAQREFDFVLRNGDQAQFYYKVTLWEQSRFQTSNH